MLDPWIGTDTPGGQADPISKPTNDGDNHPVMSNPGEIIGYDANGYPIRGSRPGSTNSYSGPGPGGGGSPVGGGGSAAYGPTGATTGTTATYGGGAATAGAAPEFDAANLAMTGASGTISPATPGLWQNILSALGGGGGTYGSALKQYGPYIMALISSLTGSGKGKFQQIPESPQLTAARNRQLGFVDHSPTRDMYGGLLQSLLSSGQFGAFRSPAPLAGGQFYQSQGLGGSNGNAVLAAYLAAAGQGGVPPTPFGGSGMGSAGPLTQPETDKVNPYYVR